MGIPIGACPDVNLVVKKCVRLFGKVTFYDSSMKLTKRINIKILEINHGPTETVIEFIVWGLSSVNSIRPETMSPLEKRGKS